MSNALPDSRSSSFVSARSRPLTARSSIGTGTFVSVRSNFRGASTRSASGRSVVDGSEESAVPLVVREAIKKELKRR